MYVHILQGVNSTVANATFPARVMYSLEPESAGEEEARDGSWRARIMHPGSELSVTLNHKFRQRRFSDFARHSWSSFSLAGENVGITWVKPPAYIRHAQKRTAALVVISGCATYFKRERTSARMDISCALFFSLFLFLPSFLCCRKFRKYGIINP